MPYGTDILGDEIGGRDLLRRGSLRLRRLHLPPGGLIMSGTPGFHLRDNEKLRLGDAEDAEVYYDGTDLIINPRAVGTGQLMVLGDANTQEVILQATDGAIKSKGDTASGLGMIVEHDGGKAVMLTAGTGSCVFQFDDTSVFRVQKNARSRIIVGDESGHTTLFSILASGFVGVLVDTPLYPIHIKTGEIIQGYFEGTTHSLVMIDAPNNGEKSVSLLEGINLKWKMGMDNAPSSPDFRDDFVIKQINNANPEFIITTDSLFGMSRDGLGADPLGQLHIEQTSTSAAVPVLLLDQRDVSEQGIKFTLNAASPVDADINLFTVDVDGTPTLMWDESDNDFNFNKGLDITGNIVVSGTVDGVDIATRDHAKYTNAEAITAVQGEATLELAGDVTIDGAKSLSVDVINEKDSAAGVTIDSLLIKDGAIPDEHVTSRRSAPTVIEAKCTTNTAITGTGDTDITGLTATFTPDIGSTAIVWGVVDIDVATIGNGFAVELDVDGADEADLIVATGAVANDRNTLGQVWVLNLSAASHTLKMQGHRIGGSGNATIRATHSRMVIWLVGDANTTVI